MIPERLSQLRREMEQRHIDVYVVPTADFHESEYVGAHFKARSYITGFTGSAGTAIITMTEAGLWTDARYFLQAKHQLENTGVTLYRMGEEGVPTIMEYLRSALPEGGTLDIGARLLPADDDGTTWYELSVADSGTGIADDIMPHIFEPFFTTHRQAGRAAGLGLSVATGLAHGRGGQITAANRPEGGALFRLLLPLPVSESRSEGNE